MGNITCSPRIGRDHCLWCSGRVGCMSVSGGAKSHIHSPHIRPARYRPLNGLWEEEGMGLNAVPKCAPDRVDSFF